ncbi:MAG: GCN5-related N-acetyltransferase [Dactylosporangium sp.]|nr:GCN5-related N-acetyltransferase [Dactylosporangium sp.]
MLDLTLRGYDGSDAPALSALFNLIEREAGGHAGFTDGFMDSIVCGMVHDPASDTRLLFTPEGELVAAGIVPTPPDGGFRVDVIGGVHPRWRGRGIGRELLGWEHDRAADIHRAVAPGAAWEIHVGALAEDETTISLYRRFDLTPVRYWFDMVASTASTTAVVPPAGLQSTTYRSTYEKDLYEAHMEAFADHWGFQRRDCEEWATLTVRSQAFIPELSVVASDGDEIAGYVLSYGDADPARIYIGQVGVRRPWRRRGLAGALLSRVLDAARAAGKDFAALGVDADSPTGAVGVYERVGFTAESRAVTYSRSLMP